MHKIAIFCASAPLPTSINIWFCQVVFQSRGYPWPTREADPCGGQQHLLVSVMMKRQPIYIWTYFVLLSGRCCPRAFFQLSPAPRGLQKTAGHWWQNWSECQIRITSSPCSFAWLVIVTFRCLFMMWFVNFFFILIHLPHILHLNSQLEVRCFTNTLWEPRMVASPPW